MDACTVNAFIVFNLEIGNSILYVIGFSARGKNTMVWTLATQSVEGGIESTGHRENILTPYFQSEGIGVAKSGSEIYVTQNFC